MIPNIPIDNNSSAELKLFRLLQQIDQPDWTCLHSLRLKEHQYQVQGEIDFVLLGPECMLVLEVKGGDPHPNENGIWITKDRWTNTRKNSKDPFKQAESAMFSLKKLISKASESSVNPMNSLVYGFAAVFPKIRFNIESVEWDLAQCIDERDVSDPSTLWKAIENVVSFTRSRVRRHSSIADRAQLDTVLRILRPIFDVVENLHSKASETERAMVSLTEEQYPILDIILSNPRVISSGGAGTGKTFLAMEAARRKADAGTAVLFLCSSRSMARWLGSQNSHRHVEFVSNYDSHSLATGCAQMLIADEAQNYMDLEGLSEIERLLGNNLSTSDWTIFLDPNAQALVSDRFDPAALTILEEMLPTSAPLTRNCRNTSTIVSYTNWVTGADIGVARAGIGPGVECTYYSDQNEQVRKITRRIDQLFGQGLLPRDITVLSQSPFEKSVAALLPSYLKNKFKIFSHANAEEYPFDSLCFADPKEFQGFESDTIIVVDVDDVEVADRWIGNHYLSLTRSRRQLIINIAEKCKPAFDEVIERNY